MTHYQERPTEHECAYFKCGQPIMESQYGYWVVKPYIGEESHFCSQEHMQAQLADWENDLQEARATGN